MVVAVHNPSASSNFSVLFIRLGRVMERDEETSRSPFFCRKRERGKPLRSQLERELFLFIQEEKSIFRVLMVDTTAHETLFRSVQCLYRLYDLFRK